MTKKLPSALKGAHSAFVIVLVPAYWRQYGPGNFLWFSDVALLASVPALWLESPLIASTQAAGVLVLETLWIVDFGAGLVSGKSPIGIASYMFDRRLSRSMRALSLFHLWLTPVLVFAISRIGYDRRAFKYQTLVTWLVLLASWKLTKPADNVNWVYSRPAQFRSPAARAGFVLFLMAAIPLAAVLPAHLLFKRLFRDPQHTAAPPIPRERRRLPA
jgi:hypothetical protein